MAKLLWRIYHHKWACLDGERFLTFSTIAFYLGVLLRMVLDWWGESQEWLTMLGPKSACFFFFFSHSSLLSHPLHYLGPPKNLLPSLLFPLPMAWLKLRSDLVQNNKHLGQINKVLQVVHSQPMVNENRQLDFNTSAVFLLHLDLTIVSNTSCVPAPCHC